jgi:excisionase family DNA binding protein
MKQPPAGIGGLFLPRQTPLRGNVARPLISVAQASHALGCSPPHIRNLITSNQLPAVNIGAGHRPIYRIAYEDLQDWARARTTDPTPQQQP